MEISNLQQQVPLAPQEMATHSLEEMLCNPEALPLLQQQQQEMRSQPKPEQALACPRCNSTNTKFCYYNNYSLSQPRHFCKDCKRYWTKGGTLRNIPIGGNSRKNKRPSSSSSLSLKKTLARAIPSLPPLAYDANHFALSFARLQNLPSLALPLENPSLSNVMPSRAPGFLDLLMHGLLDSSTTNTFNSSYYGLGGHGNVEEVGGGEGNGYGDQVVAPMPFDGLGVAATVTSQVTSYNNLDGDSMLMGAQCQVGGDRNAVMDQGRDYWNDGGSTWHGLVNSFLI